MSFQLEELLRGAGQIDEVVHDLLGMEQEAYRVQDSLEPFLYDSYESGCAAMDAVAEGRKKLANVRQELVEVSASVRASHRDYVQAEARNVLPWDLVGSQLRLSGSAWFLGRDLTQLLATGIIPFWVGTKGVVRGVLESPGGTDFRPRPVSVMKTDESVEELELSMATSFRRLEQLHARNDGEIEIIQLDNSGASSWMVLIPGTQPDSPSTNPFDIQGIGEAMGYDSDEVVPAIGQALRQAGAQPGEEVVAVGHSQGGVHAMNLSQNEAFLSEFDLKFVLTAGAPVGGITAEPGISSLHLEHIQDWVPASDGRTNPDTKDRVTVTLTGEVKTPDGESSGLGPGHDQGNYAAGAELVSASTDPSLAASTAAFVGIVGLGGTARISRFKLERAPIPVMQASLKPDAPESVRDTKIRAGTR